MGLDFRLIESSCETVGLTYKPFESRTTFFGVDCRPLKVLDFSQFFKTENAVLNIERCNCAMNNSNEWITNSKYLVFFRFKKQLAKIQTFQRSKSKKLSRLKRLVR